MSLFTASLPQQLRCDYGEWPKAEMICSDSAIGCVDGQCLCEEGWTGRGDFVGSNDCHLSKAFLNACLYVFFSAGISTSIVLSIWNHHLIKQCYSSWKRGKKLVPKTLAYIGFILEGIWSSSGTAYRIASGNRYGYGFLANLFMTCNISFFITALYLFIKSWVSLSIQATSTGSKRSATLESSRIIRALRYQLITCCSCITICFIAMLFIVDEVNVYREHLTRGVNVFTAFTALFGGVALYRSGKILGKAIKLAGAEDEKLAKLGSNMLKTTNILTIVFGNIGVVLLVITVIPFLIHYQMIVIALNFASAHIAPIAITLLLEAPPWSRKKSRVGVSSSMASRSSNSASKSSGSKNAKSSNSSDSNSSVSSSTAEGKSDVDPDPETIA